MAWTQEEQRQARELLTRLYPAARTARRVLFDARLDPNGFNFEGDARTMWQGIVEELVNRDALDAVVGVARQEYPRNPALLALDAARAAGPAAVTGGVGSPAAPLAGASAPSGGTWRVRAEGAVDFRKLSGAQWRALQAALVDTFSFEELRALVRHHFNQNLHAVVSTQNLSTAVSELIEWSQARGWTERLYRAARAERPDHAALTAFALSSAAPGAGAAPIADGALERRLRETAPDVKLVDLVRQLGAAQVRVCRVELDGRAEGTGFLVGPAAVMTCHHVVRRVLSKAVAPSAVKVRFDWHPGSDGTPVALAADWCVHSLPPEDFELFGSAVDGEPDERHLDFAVLRLAEPVGAMPVVAVPGMAAAPRGWFSLPAGRVELTERTPLYVVQHPDGRSMEVALEMEGGARFNAARTRVSHAVNTEPGSSGSPVFTFDGAPVALHHAGSSSVVRTRNQAVPIDLIRAELENFGVLGELEPKSK